MQQHSAVVAHRGQLVAPASGFRLRCPVPISMRLVDAHDIALRLRTRDASACSRHGASANVKTPSAKTRLRLREVEERELAPPESLVE
jgi:hypothetical protein